MKDIHDILLSRRDAFVIIRAIEALASSGASLSPDEKSLLDRLKNKVKK